MYGKDNEDKIMFILHYSLGFPPYRSGGLTKYCMDLMRQEVKDGHQVSLMWPGEMRLFSKGTRIRKNKMVEGIGSYEVINPTPVSYDEGIKDFKDFLNNGDQEAYIKFLTSTKPDVIHVHTLMGLHYSFLTAAKKLGIRLVFTAHDFFPICPKVTMFREGSVCDSVSSCEKCGVCNNTALSIKKIMILQSPLYRCLKDSSIVKKLRKSHRDEYLGNDTNDNTISVGSANDFLSLRDHYYSMLKSMDMIHYNSEVTKKVYEMVFELPDNKVLGITHSDISDHRVLRQYTSDKLRIRYLGPQSKAKGYYAIKDALDELWKIRQDFVLDVHFTPTTSAPYLIGHDRYSYDQLESIFNETDILVCPSIWFETFGFTVLEALSYGVPVIISDHVGARDVLGTDCGMVYKNDDLSSLVNLLRDLDGNKLTAMNKAICDHQEIMTMKDLAEETYKIYH